MGANANAIVNTTADPLAGLRQADRIRLEDLLRAMHENEYLGREQESQVLAGATGVPAAQVAADLETLVRLGLARRDGSRLLLGETGRARALQLVRAHRLYETYLANRTGVRADQWHARAHAAEHGITADGLDALARELGNPRFDPHGDPIPTSHGGLPRFTGLPLADIAEGRAATILHIEDEPPAWYARIEALGLAAGMRVELRGRGERGLRVEADGLEIELPDELAAQIRVGPLPPAEAALPKLARLSSLAEGESAVVHGLSAACRGAERQRLLDLGFVPGSRIERDLAGAFNGPVAYRVRGTLIALRREQSDHIVIEPEVAAHEGDGGHGG